MSPTRGWEWLGQNAFARSQDHHLEDEDGRALPPPPPSAPPERMRSALAIGKPVEVWCSECEERKAVEDGRCGRCLKAERALLAQVGKPPRDYAPGARTKEDLDAQLRGEVPISRDSRVRFRRRSTPPPEEPRIREVAAAVEATRPPPQPPEEPMVDTATRAETARTATLASIAARKESGAPTCGCGRLLRKDSKGGQCSRCRAGKRSSSGELRAPVEVAARKVAEPKMEAPPIVEKAPPVEKPAPPRVKTITRTKVVVRKRRGVVPPDEMTVAQLEQAAAELLRRRIAESGVGAEIARASLIEVFARLGGQR